MKTNKKLIIIISIAAVVLAGASTIVLVFKSSSKAKLTPDPARQSDEQIRKYVQSEQFNELSERDRGRYMRSVMGQRITSQAKKYSELPAEQRTAYIDEVIDSMQAWREQMPRPDRRNRDGNDPNFQPGRRRREQPEGEQRQRRQIDPSQMRARMESLDPARQAQMQAFMNAMRQRMQERGIEGPGGGRGGRPGR